MPVISKDIETNSVLREVSFERTLQKRTYGVQNHNPLLWLSILGEEFGEVSKEIYEINRTKNPCTPNEVHRRLLNLRQELIQVAAVAVSMVESLDRNELKNT